MQMGGAASFGLIVLGGLLKIVQRFAAQGIGEGESDGRGTSDAHL